MDYDLYQQIENLKYKHELEKEMDRIKNKIEQEKLRRNKNYEHP